MDNFQEPIKAVAISGLHRGDNPQPGAAVIASLRRRFPKLRIVGLSYDPLESCLFSRGSDQLDAAYLLPYPGVGANALLERLEAILDQETIDFAIPCLDSEIMNFVTIQPELLKRGVQCVLPTKQSFERRNKENLRTLCHHLDIPAPETRASTDPGALARFAEKIGFPVYVKGKYYGAHFVTSQEELRAAYDELIRVWGGPVLVQEVIVGEEYDFVGLGDGQGGIIGHCAIRKMLRTWAGKGFAGVVVIDPDLERLARHIIGALRWNGPFELEFIKAPSRPNILFEMNPRFPAWVDFPSQVGCNLPGRLLERLFDGGQSPLRACSPGQMFVRHCIDLAGDIADLATMASVGQRVNASTMTDFKVMS